MQVTLDKAIKWPIYLHKKNLSICTISALFVHQGTVGFSSCSVYTLILLTTIHSYFDAPLGMVYNHNQS